MRLWIARGAWRALGAGVIVALFAGAHGAAAETLEETLTKTYQTSPDLAAERAALRAVDEGVSQANAKWRPSLAIEGEIEHTRDHVKNDFGKYDARSQEWSADLVATQPLFTGGRNATQKRLAMARVHAARARLRMKEQRVLMEAITAYVDAARNEVFLDLARGDIVLLQELERETNARVAAKAGTESDIDQVLAASEAARAECLQTLAALHDSWRAYEQVVGEPPAVTAPPGEAPQTNPCIDVRGERLRSNVTLPVDLVAAPASVDAVEAAARGHVPELDEARAEEEISAFEVSAAYAELLPTASLTARIGTSGEDFDPQWQKNDASVGAELNIPIFNTGAEWSEIRAAREANNRARLTIVSRQRQVMRDALHAWYDLVSIRAVRAVNKVQAATLLQAFEGLRREMTNPKLNRSVTDLLALRLAHLLSRKVLVNSQRDEALAIYRLMAATGNLNATFLKLPVETYDPNANLKTQATRIIGDSIQGE